MPCYWVETLTPTACFPKNLHSIKQVTSVNGTLCDCCIQYYTETTENCSLFSKTRSNINACLAVDNILIAV